MVITTDLRRLRRTTVSLPVGTPMMVGRPAVGATVAAYAMWNGFSSSTYAWRLLNISVPAAPTTTDATSFLGEMKTTAVSQSLPLPFTAPLAQLLCGTNTCCARWGPSSIVTCRGRTQLDVRARTGSLTVVFIALTGDCVLAVNAAGRVELLGGPPLSCDASMLLPPAQVASATTFVSLSADPAGTVDAASGSGVAARLVADDDGNLSPGSLALFGVTSDFRIVGWGSRWAGELLRIPTVLANVSAVGCSFPSAALPDANLLRRHGVLQLPLPGQVPAPGM